MLIAKRATSTGSRNAYSRYELGSVPTASHNVSLSRVRSLCNDFVQSQRRRASRARHVMHNRYGGTDHSIAALLMCAGSGHSSGGGPQNTAEGPRSQPPLLLGSTAHRRTAGCGMVCDGVAEPSAGPQHTIEVSIRDAGGCRGPQGNTITGGTDTGGALRVYSFTDGTRRRARRQSEPERGVVTVCW